MSRKPVFPTSGPIEPAKLPNDAFDRQPFRQNATPPGDSLMFSGNRHESVPRALFIDRRLTPLERNAWQVLRLQLNEDGITAFPTYEHLRPWLASMPLTPLASFETVARALTLLRLTRWLSQVSKRRDARNGQIQGNLYVLHDEPLTPFEAMQLDPNYLELISQSLAHASKAIQRVGHYALKEIADDPLLQGLILPTRLQVILQRLTDNGADNPESYPQNETDRQSEEGAGALLRNSPSPSSVSEASDKPGPDGPLRYPKQDSTVRINKKRSTVPRAREPMRLKLPSCFLALKDTQQNGALSALQQVDYTMQQAVLDEWAARCEGAGIRNPAGYLFGIIQKAIQGEFTSWAGQDKQTTVSSSQLPTTTPTQSLSSPEAVQRHITKLRSLLRFS
jgi:hypothetical protein